ncbi:MULTISPECIES: TraB/GumN family protein [Burkholderiaceae]|uniref:TraB/GumN family protein n=1 Tax=Burkholderiaceae TaxID=119060 RepID=UPI0014223AB0|nr:MULTISPECIES: TraB/GumN family protein [Burkholderiaceae]NIF53560.1 TraB/GumN family protein [Burkholderia sp. Ax-1724]NIF81757.1 TraB/GumN family protein [Paraburkholderia sp. Cy-641]
MYLQLTGTNVRLLGSMHLFPATSRRTPPWVAEAYDWAEGLIFESDAPTILPFLRAGAQPGAAQLQPSMSADAWTQLQALWPAEGLLAPLAELCPWAVLIVAPTLLQQVVDGVEPRMLRSAMAQAKPCRYLETADEIAAALESIPLPVLGQALEMLMADRAEPQRTLERMYAAWIAGDLGAVERIAVESPMFNLPGIRHAILDVRNRAWAARLHEHANVRERTLVVVGALHLCGPGNLLECLARPVEAVREADAQERGDAV